MDDLDRYEALLQKMQIHFIRYGNLILREYNQIIIPLGPIVNTEKGDLVRSQEVFSKLKGKLLWWSYCSESFDDEGWYGVIKENHIEVDDYPNSNLRRKVRKGLSTFEVKLIGPQFLAANGQGIYAGVARQNGKKADILQFNKQMDAYNGFEDLVNCWGIFHEKELIGYSLVLLYDKIEGNISEIKILDGYKRHYPSYALFHRLGEYYLKEHDYTYISDGYRTLFHDTGIQDFLIKNFGFRKVGLQLNLFLRFPWNIVIKCLYPFRSCIRLKSIAAVLNLYSIYLKQRRLPRQPSLF